jgi:hypothetical protein
MNVGIDLINFVKYILIEKIKDLNIVRKWDVEGEYRSRDKKRII